MTNKLEINDKNIPIDKFSKLLPIKEFLIDYKIKKILRLRDDINTKKKWNEQGFEWGHIKNIFDIINQHCLWPNNLFWPEDELFFILRLYSSSLDGVSAVMELEENYSIEIPDFSCTKLSLLVSILLRRKK